MKIVSASSANVVYFVGFSTADHVTRVSDLTSFDVTWSLNGSTGTTVHNMTVAAANTTKMPGVYKVNLLDSTVTAIPAGMDSAELCLHIQSSMDPVTRTLEIFRRTVTTGQTLVLNTSGKVADVETILARVTSVDTKVTAIQSQTTQLAFTQSGKVDANIHYVNNVLVAGVGSTVDPWGP